MSVRKPKAWTIDGPWVDADWDPADATAIQALERGEADSEQQKRALAWIIKDACGTYELSYRPDSDRETAFAEGRRMVGLQLRKLLTLNVPAFVRATQKP